MTEHDQVFLNIIRQAKANVECENVTVSKESIEKIIDKHIESNEKKENRDYSKKKGYQYDRR